MLDALSHTVFLEKRREIPYCHDVTTCHNYIVCEASAQRLLLEEQVERPVMS
ncbi:hypothetical protein HMPREF3226_02436 [Prevotella corporis]|uniref:Uncharacterized protein n=1 Tax=Prevotella corporis TaxID=28128 RepID=A0A133PVF1_9BACT|nr:hypothetical protein HMPREF3226_02436 [Prevotella corporis]